MAKYNSLTPDIADTLQAIVGKQRFFAGSAVKPDYAHDEMPIYGRYLPEAVCLAETTEEISEIMKICNDRKIPVTVRGAGTGLVGGCVPVHGGIVLSTERMNRILEYDMKNLCVRIQPGVLLCDLAADALAHGVMYPPDPGEKSATVGGNVSTNAGGMKAVKYGVTRDYVMAMTVVLPNGEIIKLGKSVCKTSSGYSLLHLMVGSEGTLGIITELTLKLIPKPEKDVTLMLPFHDIATAIAAVPSIKLANLDPQSIEFAERDVIDSSAEFTGNHIFPTVVNGKEAGAYILVTLVGNNEQELLPKMDRLGEVAEKAGAYDTQGVYIKSFGHAGDGNLHIYCCSNDLEEDEFKRRVKKLMDASYAKCTEFEGQVSGEHAIGHAKKQYLRESVGETAYAIMGQIKTVFDPNEILNPGKVCHDPEGGAEAC